jgi:hypothetical protein
MIAGTGCPTNETGKKKAKRLSQRLNPARCLP